MRRGLTSAVLALALTAAAGSVAPAASARRPTYRPPDRATVVAVYDGDTVKVRFADGGERRVRLIGIDSPEIGDAREDVRFMAYVAKRFAFLKLYRREVRLSYDFQLEDKYGRLLAFLSTDEGMLFNELILREGFAVRFRAFPFDAGLMKRFEAAEDEARRGERGLWRRGDPPSVSPAEAAAHLGELASVAMTCASIGKRRPFVVLQPPGGEMEVLVPERRLSDFPGLEAMAGKSIIVRGLIEEFGGRTQIMVDVPLQIREAAPGRAIDRALRPGL